MNILSRFYCPISNLANAINRDAAHDNISDPGMLQQLLLKVSENKNRFLRLLISITGGSL